MHAGVRGQALPAGDGLRPGSVLRGPAVIAEDETTTIVPQGYTARINPLSAILLEKDDPA